MIIRVIYVFPMVNSRLYNPMAARFAQTYKQFRPSIDHRITVVCNGTEPHPNQKTPFEGMPCDFHAHNNLGWDIGAFQWAADNIPCDLLVCLGAPVHFHQPGWLERMADAYVENGIGLYGCWAYLSPNWHVRTTAFWMPPQVLQSYPDYITSTKQSRYGFEHGPQSFTRYVLSAGLPCIMVTRDGCFPFDQWQDHAPGQNNSLLLDQFIHQ